MLPFQISQLAVSYRRSPLSPRRGHAGHLHAGDRLPDFPVRSRMAHGDAWQQRLLYGALDPLHFTLLVVHPEASGESPPAWQGESPPRQGDSASRLPVPEAGRDWCEAVRPWESLIRVTGIAPASDAALRARFHAAFGRSSAVVLVRPDGYVGFAGGKYASARRLRDYCRRWLTARDDSRTHHAFGT